MKKIFLVLSLLGMISFLFSQATELIISEYIEGSSYNKAIEIFNGTGADVDLSEYTLEKDANGAGSWSSSYSYSGILADGDVFVLTNSQADPIILAIADDIDDGVINFNGNDAVRLLKNGVELDFFGNLSGVDFAKDVTLVRADDIASPTDVWNIDEWLEYPSNTFTYLGYHVFQNEDPTLIVTSPNGGEEWEQGSTRLITWQSMNFEDNVKIELEQVYDRSREVLEATTENDGEWEWNIPSDLEISEFYVIRISDAVDDDPTDESDNTFSIIEPIPVTPYTIYEIQNSQGGPSPHLGELVQTSGVVTAVFTDYFFIQDGPGAWNGIAVYPLQAVVVGNEIIISGEVIEYQDKTEISNIINLSIINQSVDLPEDTTITTADLAFMEEYEGVLVSVEQVNVTTEPDTYGNWEVDDGSGACVVAPLGEYTYVPILDDFIFSITGVVDFTFGSFKMCPRNDDDINLVGLIVEPLELNFLTSENCLDGLEFTISNLSATDIEIANIENNGMFPYGNPWQIEDFNLTFPYTISSGEILTFNVTVSLFTENLREIETDFLAIESEVGDFDITLNFETDVNSGTGNNLVNAQSELIGNFPNPFNPSTTINYNLAQNDHVTITIFNLKGQKVKTIISEQQSAGLHVVTWNGTDQNSKSVSSGIYLYEMWMEETDYTSIKKMILLK
jgi:lamin tail-like protein/flagellar hook capping protein FlgD